MINVLSAFGLAGSAGLNAYIPLLIVALAAYFPQGDPWLKLAAPYELLGTWWAIGLIAILLVIEMLVDKVPAVDTLNDAIQTFIRPAAGAILFASSAHLVNDIHPVLALGAGLIVAGGVHAVKSTARPVVTATTGGLGNWVVSVVEDVTAVIISLLAIFVPILAAILLILVVVWAYRFWRRRKQKRALMTK